MALRVLLADESSTIKKVFQLALQDFAVEVRPVNIGVDVAAVAATFKPDIIFADVLLQKKNGYDVCAELKENDDLKSIPVVLMWSGFMELDEDKFQASQANAQLEKPFDVTALRKLVTDLVPRTQNQRLSQFLTFPKAHAEAEKRASTDSPPPMKSEDEFAPGPAPKAGKDKYRLDFKPEELDPKHIAVDYDMPDDDEFQRRDPKKGTSKAAEPVIQAVELDMEMDELVSEDVVTVDETPLTSPSAQTSINTLSADQIEQIIRAQSAEVIESVVWKVIPELATQIIERELKKLLKERDSHP